MYQSIATHAIKQIQTAISERQNLIFTDISDIDKIKIAKTMDEGINKPRKYTFGKVEYEHCN